MKFKYHLIVQLCLLATCFSCQPSSKVNSDSSDIKSNSLTANDEAGKDKKGLVVSEQSEDSKEPFFTNSKTIAGIEYKLLSVRRDNYVEDWSPNLEYYRFRISKKDGKNYLEHLKSSYQNKGKLFSYLVDGNKANFKLVVDDLEVKPTMYLYNEMGNIVNYVDLIIAFQIDKDLKTGLRSFVYDDQLSGTGLIKLEIFSDK